MFKDFRLWVIIGLIIIIIILVITRKKPTTELGKGKIEYQEKMKEHQIPYDSAQKVIDSIALQGRLDKIRAEERERKYQIENARLKSKLKELDFSKSTDKQLDSLVTVLYGE